MIVRALREAHWLRPDRAWLYGVIAIAFSLVAAAVTFFQNLTPALAGETPGMRAVDFDAFWSGARLALAGHPAWAYQADVIRPMEETAAQLDDNNYWPYLYPPVFLLLSLPLGLFGYIPAMIGFLASSFAIFTVALRRLLPAPWPILPILAFPAVFTDIAAGQNGFITASCFAGALLSLDEAPVRAGALLGVLIYKPHLAWLAPLALLAARRWTALVSCILTSGASVVLSWAVLGTATWAAFLHEGKILDFLQHNHAVLGVDNSVYALMMRLGASSAYSWAAQMIAACACCACVVVVAGRRPGGPAEMALVVAATMLCAPHLMDYDLLCLAVPMAWLAANASLVTGWRNWEKILLAVLFVYPNHFIVLFIDAVVGVSFIPPLGLCLLACVARRASSWRSTVTC